MKRSLWPTRDPVKDYFPLPKEIFSLGLSAAEIAIYAYLLFCEDRQTFQCWPSYRKIGEAVGLSPNTIRKHIRSLEERESARHRADDSYDEGWMQRATAICSSPSDRFMRRSSRTMTGRCRSLPRTQQGGNMPILLRTQVERTAKAPIPARRARVGGLCDFQRHSRARTRRKPEDRTLRRRAGALAENIGTGRDGRGKSRLRQMREIAENGQNRGILDAAARKRRESRTKPRGSCAPRGGHICPRCGQFRGFTRAFQTAAKNSRRALQNEKSPPFQGKQRGSNEKHEVNTEKW